MLEHTSPEERLLKLIRRKDHVSLKEGNVKEPKAGSANPPVKGSQKNPTKGENFPVVLKAFEKILLSAAFVLAAYVGYEFFFVKDDLSAQRQGSADVTREASEDGGPIVTVVPSKPPDYYTEPAQTRDLFDSSITKKIDEIKTIASAPDLTKNLRLVGIVLGEVSQAIIEDLEIKETFFLRKGESFKNAVIEEIGESKVILLFGNQRVELEQ